VFRAGAGVLSQPAKYKLYPSGKQGPSIISNSIKSVK